MACCIPCCIPCCCPCGSNTDNNEEPTFCGRAVAFISGVLCFPLVSLKFAIFEYNSLRDEGVSISVSILCAVRSFLVPVPVLGALVFGVCRIIYHINPDSKFGFQGFGVCLDILVCMPLLGSGILNVELLSAH